MAEGDTLALDEAVLATLRDAASPALDALAPVASALGSEVVAILLVLLLGSFAVRRQWCAARIAWTGLLVVTVLLIDVSRLYLGVHYLTDVVAGNAIGVAWVAAVVGAGNLLSLHRRPPAAPSSVPASE